MTDDKIKENLIKYFGEEKWEEEEILEFLQPLANYLCNEYIHLEPLPIVFESIPGNITILNLELMCIMVNPKYKYDKIQMMAGIVHELEHYYQLAYCKSLDTKKARRWRYELANYINENNPIGNVLQDIEIDAEAFAEVVLYQEFGIKYINPDPNLQVIIEKYISSGKLLED